MTNYLLIFGGSGFIGQAICKEAVDQKIPVVSISRRGEPQNLFLRNHPLITWVKSDIFTDKNWQQYVVNASGVINLIGILRENQKKRLTYQKMIVLANQLIADQVAHYPQIPYVFLSANANGPLIPKEYLEHKRLAENDLNKLTNPVTIVRPGLVIGVDRPLSLIEGGAVFFLAHLPILRVYFRPVFPIKAQRLAVRVIWEIRHPSTSCITPDDL